MREIYGICVNNLTIDQKKLVRLMQDTIPDFPSDNESVYADYITDCKQKNIFLTPEDWMQNYTFFDGWMEYRGIGALLYKNLRVSLPKKLIFCRTGSAGETYIGETIYEPYPADMPCSYVQISELNEILKIYTKKISNDVADIRLFQYS